MQHGAGAKGKVGTLRGEIQHFAYRDISDHLDTIDRYTTLAAQQMHDGGRRAGLLQLAGHPPLAFLRNYIARGGMRDALSLADQLLSIAGDAATLADLDKLSAAAGGEADEALFNALEYRRAEPLFLKVLDAGDLTQAESIKARECLAEIYAGSNRMDQAVEQYRKILEAAPNFLLPSDSSPKLQEIFTKARGQMPAPVAQKTEKPIQPQKSPHKAMRAAAWVCTGVSVVGIGTGVIYYAQGASQYQDFKNAESKSKADAARKEVRTDQTVSQTGFGIGLASGIAAIPLFIYSKDETKAAMIFAPGRERQFLAVAVDW